MLKIIDKRNSHNYLNLKELTPRTKLRFQLKNYEQKILIIFSEI